MFLHVHHVLVVVVREDVRVVEGALPDAPLVVDELPRGARVVRAEEAPVVVLEEGVDAVRIRARDRHPDPAHDALGRHPRISGHLGPRAPAVDALEHAAARPTGRHRVLLAEGLPERRVEHLRIVAVDHEVDGAGALVAEEDPLPAVSAVGAPEDAPLLARHAVLPEGRHIDDVRIGRMNADLRYSVRFPEADVLPGFAPVAAPVDAVPGQDVAANAGLAGADEDEIGVGLADRDRADRRRADLEIGDGIPVLTAVDGLPKAAAGGAEVGFLGPAPDAGDGDGAAAPVGTEVAPRVAGQEGRVEDHGCLGVEGGCERARVRHVHVHDVRHDVRERRDPRAEPRVGQGGSNCGERRDEQKRLEWEALHGSISCGFLGAGMGRVKLPGRRRMQQAGGWRISDSCCSLPPVFRTLWP